MLKSRTLVVGILAALLLGVASFATLRAHTFTGEITDGTCGNAGAHTMMATSGDPITAKKQCTIACVKLGETYVLYNADTKTVYDLSDQKTPEQFAGEKVIIIGTLDKTTLMIRVLNIRAAS
jgi:hypothetical protein